MLSNQITFELKNIYFLSQIQKLALSEFNRI